MRNKYPDDITIVLVIVCVLAAGALVGLVAIESGLPDVVKILLNIGGGNE